jgi:Major Facilitator Superfamily
MTTTTFSNSASSISGSDQEKSKQRKLVDEKNPRSHKEMGHTQHKIIADIDTERDVEDQSEVEKTASENINDPNLVTWDSPTDPENPRNWSFKRKWAAVFVVSSFTFISPVSSSMVAPALGIMKTDLGISDDFEAAMILSIFVLSYAIGPLFFGPLSEIFGRVRVLQYSNLIYLIFNFICGFAKNGPQMLAFRFFAGLGELTKSFSILNTYIKLRWQRSSCIGRRDTFRHL